MTYEEGIYLSPMTIGISIGFGLVYLFSSESMRNNLSDKNYEFYLIGIYGFSLIFGFTSVHVARLLVAFGATGLPAFTHFFKTKEIPTVKRLPISTRFVTQSAVVFSILFITVLLIEYDYYPYNTSKNINWESEDDLEDKLGDYETGDYENRYPRNEIVESILIPLLLVILIVAATGFVILNIWKRMKKQMLHR